MALKIAQLGQPVLRQPAKEIPVERIRSAAFQELLQEMLATLRAEKGVGLAAPQVFTGERVFLAAIVPAEQENEPPGVIAFINPRIEPITDEKTKAWEGCLSFPELLVLVPRYRAVRIDYVDMRGEPEALELTDFPARVVQHEFDHLEGILTLDRAESTRDIIKASEIETVVKERPEKEE